MMMGSLEEDISTATTAPENQDDVINDLDLTEEEIALENREEYLNKVGISLRYSTYINYYMIIYDQFIIKFSLYALLFRLQNVSARMN